MSVSSSFIRIHLNPQSQKYKNGRQISFLLFIMGVYLELMIDRDFWIVLQM